jgi:catalase
VVANPGDVTDKAIVEWTGPHRSVEAGVLTLSAVQSEEQGACRDLNFDPTILPSGIAPSDDPLLGARSKPIPPPSPAARARARGPAPPGRI